MATNPSRKGRAEVIYPTRDGKPFAETDWHRECMFELITVLKDYYEANPMVCVSGNLLMYYVPGEKRQRVCPDVFVVRGVPKRERDNYLVWEEGRAPDLVIEVTSRATRREDLGKKFALYRDVLRVAEYVLFDPRAEYLDPPLQGHRLIEGQYVRIEPASGRLPSAVLGLEMEPVGHLIRFYNPAAGRNLPSGQSVWHLVQELEVMRRDAEATRQAVEATRQAVAARQKAEAETERLRLELEELRRRRDRAEE